MGKGRMEFLEMRMRMLEEQMAKEMEIQEKVGEDDDYPDLSVIIWSQKFSGPRKYTFVALKVAGRWYTTSQWNTVRTWEELVEYHLSKADGPVCFASEWTEV